MNIDPLDISNQLYRTQVNGRQNHNGHARPEVQEANGGGGSDRVATDLSSKVRARLAEIPEVRPEVVERGRKLLADPNYPTPDIMREIASLITPLPED